MTASLTEKVVDAHSSGTAAGSTTVATVRYLRGRPLASVEQMRVRLNVTTPLIGDTPTLDVYLQRPVAEDPDPTVAADWEDFYHFPQVTTAAVDKVVSLPLPAAQDVDASLGSMSRTRAVETLAADTALGGHWDGPIRIRQVLATGGVISQAAVYDVEMVGR